jgi:hypothetical protein
MRYFIYLLSFVFIGTCGFATEEILELTFPMEVEKDLTVDDDWEEAELEIHEINPVADYPAYTPPPPQLTICKKCKTPCPPSKPNWYFEIKPGYYFLTDHSMRQFFDNGGFTLRGEAGYKLWGPLTLWFDGGYFQKNGYALGGTEKSDLLLATLSLGLKTIFYPHDRFAFYLGAAPRLFLMMLDNDSPYVRGTDNEIGLGGGFQGGIWLFPISGWKNFFIDLFADYSWKVMKIDPDEISSEDFDVDVSGVSAGIGLGIRF